MQTRFSYRTLSLSVLVLLVFWGSACAPAQQSPSSSQETSGDAKIVEGIGQLATASTNAREGVLLVRQYVSDEGSWEYTEARRLYSDAQSAFNGWIEQLKADLQFEVEPDQETYDASLSEALEKTTAFLGHVQQVEATNASVGKGSSTNAESSSSEQEDVAAMLVLGIATKIVTDIVVVAGIDLWKAHQEMQAEEKERDLVKRIEYLDSLLWASFDDIR